MNTRRLHLTNAGRSSKPTAFGIEGLVPVYAVAGSMVISIGIFLLLFGAFNFNFLAALLASAVLPVAVVAIILTLVRGKPQNYLDEFIEWTAIRLGYSRLFCLRTLPPRHD